MDGITVRTSRRNSLSFSGLRAVGDVGSSPSTSADSFFPDIFVIGLFLSLLTAWGVSVRLDTKGVKELPVGGTSSGPNGLRSVSRDRSFSGIYCLGYSLLSWDFSIRS